MITTLYSTSYVVHRWLVRGHNYIYTCLQIKTISQHKMLQLLLHISSLPLVSSALVWDLCGSHDN